MFSLFSWAAIKIRSFVFKVQKNLSSRCLCFPDCDLFLSFLFFLSFYALINHSLDFHALFPSSGNSFVMLSLRTSGLLAVSWNSLFTGFACLQVPLSKAFVCECADANDNSEVFCCHWKTLNPCFTYHHCAAFISRAFSVLLSVHHLTSSNSHWF